MSLTIQRVTGLLLLLVAGLASLPVVAFFLDGQDGEGTENWIVPVQLLVMALVGAAVTVAIPALAMAGASTRARAFTGAGWGVAAAGVGVVVFFLLISGIDGA